MHVYLRTTIGSRAALICLLVAAACAVGTRGTATPHQVVAAESLGREIGCASTPAAPFPQRDRVAVQDDTTEIMMSVGARLSADYRCGPLFFAPTMICQRADSACIRKNEQATASAALVRPVETARQWARGVACVPGNCPGQDSMLVMIRLGPLRIRGDSASVGVEIRPRAAKAASTFHYYVHRYDLVRIGPAGGQYRWILYARFEEAIGHAGRP